MVGARERGRGVGGSMALGPLPLSQPRRWGQGASGISHLHFSLITSSPHSACGVTDTPREPGVGGGGATRTKKGLPTTLQLAL